MVNRWIWGLLILLFLGLLTYIATPLFNTTESIISVDKALKSVDSEGKRVIVRGLVADNSFYHDPVDGALTFKLKSESGKEMKVIYASPVSEGLVSGSEVTIEGTYTVEQVFLANKLWISNTTKSHSRQRDNFLPEVSHYNLSGSFVNY